MRASVIAWMPFRWWTPAREIERVTAVRGATGDARADPWRLDGDAADVVDELREVPEVDHDHVVDLDPGQLLDDLDVSFGPPHDQAALIFCMP